MIFSDYGWRDLWDDYLDWWFYDAGSAFSCTAAIGVVIVTGIILACIK